MIGSPAGRDAASSLGWAGRNGLAVASGASSVSAAIAANVTGTASLQHHVATLDCAILVRFAMSRLRLLLGTARGCVDRVSNHDGWIANSILCQGHEYAYLSFLLTGSR